MKNNLIKLIEMFDEEEDKGILKIIYELVKSIVKDDKNKTHSD